MLRFFMIFSGGEVAFGLSDNSESTLLTSDFLSACFVFYNAFFDLFFSFYSLSHYLLRLVQILDLKSFSWSLRIIFSISASAIKGMLYQITMSCSIDYYSIFAKAWSRSKLSIIVSCCVSSTSLTGTKAWSSSLALILLAFSFKTFWYLSTSPYVMS